MAPLLLAALSALTGGFAAHAYDKAEERKHAQRNVLGAYATSLEPGRVYQLMVQVDPSNAAWQAMAGTAADPRRAMGTAFAQLGWQLFADPVPLSPQELQNWQTGKPATWTFAGRWTLPSNAMPAPAWAAWIGMMNAYLLPST